MVLAGDAAGLKTLYSVNPVARIVTASREVDADAAIHYWVGLKARSLKVEVTKDTSTEPGKRLVLFQAEILTAATGSEKTFYIFIQRYQRDHVRQDEMRLIFLG